MPSYPGHRLRNWATGLSCATAVAILVGAVRLANGADTVAAPAGKVDFVSQIQPILKETCFECHGPQKQKGKLRLDSKELALQGGGSGPAIVPGKSGDSYLVKRILGEGDEDAMPLKHDRLTPAQVAVIKAWIDQGADWPKDASVAGAEIARHWAYQAPVRPVPPLVKDAAWVRNPIDAFVLARLEKEGLAPAPQADRVTLIRRLSLDLIGLPPTLAEVDAFVADPSPDAYEKQVDRLLASPHYGERWGRHWLDLARYADTNGYEKDRTRTIWPYRDWVINALNSDMPFDEFTIEQIAGDMLPNPTPQQLIATGFHRNTMTNEEGGIDVEEFRYKNIVDRVQTTATTWLGTTLHCAQCHNHKYDPITQKEYYQFYALLNNADEPVAAVPSEEVARKRREVEVKIARLESGLEAQYVKVAATLPSTLPSTWPAMRPSTRPSTRPTTQLAQTQEAWEKEIAARSAHWTVLEPLKFSRNYGGTIAKLDDHSLLFTGDNLYRDDYRVEFRTDLSKITAIRMEVLPDAAQPKNGPGRSPAGGWLVSEFTASIAPALQTTPPPSTSPSPVVFDHASADYGKTPEHAIDGKKDTHWVASTGDAKPHEIVFHAKSAFGFEGGTKLAISIVQNYHQQENVGRLRISVTADAGDIQASGVPAAIETIVLIPGPERSAAQRAELRNYFLSVTPLLAALHKQIDALRASMPRSVETLVMQERPTPRVTNIHRRGEFLNLGAEVQPSVPAVLPPLPAGQPRNRLSLARWLASVQNPLTPRVIMNRTWGTYFGRGIVRSGEDFGIMGETPSHPQLLDWLATEFIAQHWSMKSMHRLIVTSATYRQSSRVPVEMWRKDPANELLARGPRLRVEAEIVRDIALSAAGLLEEKIGGPSVFPPQPDGVSELSYTNEKWNVSGGPDRFRRGMYTFLKRTAPHPQLITFDAPTSEMVCARRIRSDTPLQALTVLNDATFMEAAQGLARRIVTQGPKDNQGRATLAFRLCMARSPDSLELEQILSFYREQLKRFRESEDDAIPVASSVAVPAPPGADQSELAAWTTVSRALLNLDETITKE